MIASAARYTSTGSQCPEWLGVIITPAFCQVSFTSGDQLRLDQEKLFISGKTGHTPFEKGNAYGSALPYIKCRAIGINFDVTIKVYDTLYDAFVVDEAVEHQAYITVIESLSGLPASG